MTDNIPILTTFPGTTNLVPNPSFEVNDTGWTKAVTGTVTGSFARDAVNGGWAGLCTETLTISASTLGANLDVGSIRTAALPIDNTLEYAASFDLKPGSINLTAYVKVEWLNASSVVVQTDVTPVGERVSYTTGDYTRVVLEHLNPPATATQAYLYGVVYSLAANVVNIIRLDGFQLEPGGVFTEYCDGTQPNCFWTGTAHASSSFRRDRTISRYVSKSGAIKITPSLYLVDKFNNIRADLSDTVIGGSVEMDYMRDVKTTCSLTVTEDNLFDPFADRLAVWLSLEYPDGEGANYQCGLFTADLPKKTWTAKGPEIQYDCYDETYTLSQITYAKTYQVAAGANIVTTVKNILAAYGYTRINIPAMPDVIGGKGWSRKANTTLLSIINDLLAGCGLYHLFTDRTGVLTSFPYISRANREPVKRYIPGDDGAVLEPFTASLVERPYNHVYVTRELNDVTIVGEAKNNNAASPWGIPKAGEKVWQENSDKIQTQAAADRRAQELLEEYGMLQLEAELTTLPEPWHDIHELYEVALTLEDGTVIPDATGVYWCFAFKFGFGPQDARMTHKLKKFVELRDF